jgi:hypothetical protein
MAIIKSLGELGVVHDDVEVTFQYFGETIRVHPLAGELSYVEFMANAASIDEEDDRQGLPLMMDFLKEQIHPDDFDQFFKLAKLHRQSLQELMGVSRAILENATGFPTGQPSDSPAGRRATPKKSRAGSSSRGTSRARGGRPAAERAMEMLEGRPDLQMVVVRAQEAALAV